MEYLPPHRQNKLEGARGRALQYLERLRSTARLGHWKRYVKEPAQQSVVNGTSLDGGQTEWLRDVVFFRRYMMTFEVTVFKAGVSIRIRHTARG